MAYVKKTWVDEEVISKDALNNIENGIASANSGLPSNATKAKAGLVKQAALVPEAAAEQVTKAEFKALLDSLKAAGIMANS